MNRAKAMLETQLEDARKRCSDALTEIDIIKTQISEVKDGIEGWKGFRFESSSSLTPEFEAFIKDFRAWVKSGLPEGAGLVGWNKGHFDCSGFITKGAQFVYFSIPDVRFYKDVWYNNILIRTAKHAQDYTGGANCYTSVPKFKMDVADLLKGE